ncbi:hypothetical protein CROQUDRAFT_685933 [Cronartium quercuum f. sp. fusiforme G11]|uniref:Hydrophobin n=1 Tax=Cronartium quercuum f. sp. fusiforme G11 TaxID=708437 RepID=A0A9P6T7B0_9BASI|nr:hypothetical protein CROQUDRAFT_685933 [Cronartium quercuum f. sp. fusiforme G11]
MNYSRLISLLALASLAAGSDVSSFECDSPYYAVCGSIDDSQKVYRATSASRQSGQYSCKDQNNPLASCCTAITLEPSSANNCYAQDKNLVYFSCFGTTPYGVCANVQKAAMNKSFPSLVREVAVASSSLLLYECTGRGPQAACCSEFVRPQMMVLQKKHSKN